MLVFLWSWFNLNCLGLKISDVKYSIGEGFFSNFEIGVHIEKSAFRKFNHPPSSPSIVPHTSVYPQI